MLTVVHCRSSAIAEHPYVVLVKCFSVHVSMVSGKKSMSQQACNSLIPCIDAIPKKRGPKTDVLEALLKRVDGLEAQLKDTRSGEQTPAASPRSLDSLAMQDMDDVPCEEPSRKRLALGDGGGGATPSSTVSIFGPAMSP